MTLLGTAAAVDLLAGTARAAGVGDRVEERFALVQALLASDLSYVEAELGRVAREGEAPGTSAASHLVGAGGKRIRPVTLLLSAACFGSVPAAARELAVVAELVHSATLLHDDVVDDSPERRGTVTARRVWGNAVSVLGGDLLLAHALHRTLAAAPDVMPDLLVTLRRLVDGEIVQLRGRTAIDTSEATYFRVLEDKTASLFGWAARAGARVAGASEPQIASLGHFGERLGVAFQLVDDVLDYAGDPGATGKVLLSDLTEGKVTLPLVLALVDEPQMKADLAAARQGEAEAAARLGARVRASRACDEVRARAVAETSCALAALEQLEPSPARQILAAVASDLTERSK
jgi:octaprenyl-diphosphate synthase